MNELETLVSSNDNYNLYAYCCNSPVNFCDNDGRKKVKVLFMIDKGIQDPSTEDGGLIYRETLKAIICKLKYIYRVSGGDVANILVDKDTFLRKWRFMEYHGYNVVVLDAHGAPNEMHFVGGNVTSEEEKNLIWQEISFCWK